MCLLTHNRERRYNRNPFKQITNSIYSFYLPSLINFNGRDFLFYEFQKTWSTPKVKLKVQKNNTMLEFMLYSFFFFFNFKIQNLEK